jgi:biopolymer transport protein ExbB
MELTMLLKSGGITIVILVACSILSVAIILERLIYYWRRSKVRRVDFMARVRALVQRGEIDQALGISENTDTPFAHVVYAGLSVRGHDEALMSNAMQRQITVEINNLERYTAITGTIGSVAVYIGLFGTVLGIIRAFREISASSAGGLSFVINGIAEALICTAGGLVVAVPAVVFYNYFAKRINSFTADMELCASEITDLIKNRQK